MATLYKGVWVSIIGIYPYIGTNFMVYGTLKDWAVEHYKVPDANKLPWSVTFAIGGFAGAAAQTVAYPFDLLRCVIVAHLLSKRLDSSTLIRNGLLTHAQSKDPSGGLWNSSSSEGRRVQGAKSCTNEHVPRHGSYRPNRGILRALQGLAPQLPQGVPNNGRQLLGV